MKTFSKLRLQNAVGMYIVEGHRAQPFQEGSLEHREWPGRGLPVIVEREPKRRASSAPGRHAALE